MKYQRLRDCSKDYNISPASMLQLARRGILNCIKLGGTVLVDLEKPFLKDVSYRHEPRKRRVKGEQGLTPSSLATNEAGIEAIKV